MSSSRKAKAAAFVAMSTIGLIAPLAVSAPANALTNVGTIAGVETRCNNSTYFLCLYFNSGMNTGWWGTSTTVPNLSSPTVHRFAGGASMPGVGEPVKNNAAAVSCDASATSICYVFYNSPGSGPTDWLYGQRSGQLQETYNQNASVRISIGA